jgi:hypothetical protein
MFSTVAMVLALNFWAPYTSNGKPPCAVRDVKINTIQTGASLPRPAIGYGSAFKPETMGFAYYGAGCEIYLRPEIQQKPYPVQCAFIAHELGHAAFSLPDVEDGSLMDSKHMSVPGACVLHFHRPAM